MKINKTFIKIILFFNFINIIFCAIEDPVARHDLSECATYLCPTYKNMAKDYLASGCVGDFKDYFELNYIEKNNELNMLSENTIDKKEYINLNTLLFLTTFSSLISLYIGYIFSKNEKENEIKYLMRVL